MQVSDEKVFDTMQKVAAMEPDVKRISDSFDNGVLDKKIQKAVESGIKGCPFYIEGKAKKKISSTVRWIVTISIPIILTILTLFASGAF